MRHIRNVSLVIASIFMCLSAHGQTLCNISEIKLLDDGVQVTFDGKVDLDALVVDEKSTVHFDLKSGLLSSDGKKTDYLVAKKTGVVYVSQGLAKSCVLHAEEHDGKQGLYIEEHTHITAQPLRMFTEFVEAF